ncbi:hypothetical protein O181_023086 [Austropuccinia psidii MF-1]|uniref:Uncharacterized protein n=1 Tax=Austropuccinia psidii MF-1 TaxID=1389203 RepID=A0A9Q3GXB6_9BASI|nr:hypothetical protein [Austropuccinia psidii MF-1]
MKESGQVSLYIADFRRSISISGDWGEKAYIHVYRRGLASRLLDKLASHPENFDSLQELMGITLELDTRYHERQKEKVVIKRRSLHLVDPIPQSLPKELPEKVSVSILYSNGSTSLLITHYTKWVVDLSSFSSFEWYSFTIDSPKGEGLILGYVFLYHFNPIIDWKNEFITYDSSHKASSGIIFSTSIDFATGVNSVALVGELKTPSISPSVNIPSIIPSQSLLLSRDEVFKEIKDVGADFPISSLHLFQGAMDLPPLSFHASLEEQ